MTITSTAMIFYRRFSHLLVTLGLSVGALASLKGASEIVLRNEFVELKFDEPEKGGRLTKLLNPQGHSFISKSSAPIWKIDLKRIDHSQPDAPTVNLSFDPAVNDGVAEFEKGGESLTVTSESGGEASYELDPKGSRVVLHWKNLSVGDEAKALDVSLEVTVAPGDRYARFRTRFENRSRNYTAYYLYSPIISGIHPEGQALQKDYLAVPAHNGRLIRNPIQNGIFGKPIYFEPNRSSHSMQFDAYGHGEHGVLMAALDGSQLSKRFMLKATPEEGLEWAVVHLPNNMKTVPQVWDTPYDTVLACYQGDWFTACELYRGWALEQDWASEGPIVKNPHIPQWFKDVDEFLLANSQKMRDLKAMAPLMDRYNVALWTTHWGKGGYFQKDTPDRFPLRNEDLEFLEFAEKNRYAVVGYLQGICWDVEIGSFKNEGGYDNAVKNMMGQSVVWDFSYRKDEPCVQIITTPGETWTRVLGDTAVEMLNAGFSGVYLDSTDHGGTYLNFNPKSGSDQGGGADYIKGMRQVTKEIRERARKGALESIFSGESFWEANIAEMDTMLSSNSTNHYLHQDIVTAIPMAQAVYHDYIILYGTWVSEPDLEEEGGRSYLAKFGQDFVFGVKPGWNQPFFLTRAKNSEVAVASSLHRYEAYSAAKDYLLYGTMLRPPKVKTESKALAVKWYVQWTKRVRDVTLAPVMASLWRSPSGELAVVLYNFSDQPQKATALISHSDLQGEAPFVSGLSPVYAQPEAKAHLTNEGWNITVFAEIPAMQPVIYRLTR